MSPSSTRRCSTNSAPVSPDYLVQALAGRLPPQQPLPKRRARFAKWSWNAGSTFWKTLGRTIRYLAPGKRLRDSSPRVLRRGPRPS